MQPRHTKPETQAQKIRNRIRLRLGAISGSTLVSGKSLPLRWQTPEGSRFRVLGV